MNKLQKLAKIEGYSDPLDMIETFHCDSVVPAICSNPGCDYTAEYEPDSKAGYCEVCGTQTVVSCLVLAGVI